MPLLLLLVSLFSLLLEGKQRGGSNLVRIIRTMPKSIQGYLQARGPSSSATLVARRDVDAVECDGGVLVKSLIWEYDGVPVLLVLQLDRLVDKAKLADHLCVSKDAVGLVDRERASHLAGYQIGTMIHMPSKPLKNAFVLMCLRGYLTLHNPYPLCPYPTYDNDVRDDSPLWFAMSTKDHRGCSVSIRTYSSSLRWFR